MIVQSDPALISWVLGISNGKPTRAGDFLRAVANAALRADTQNYEILRPALLELKEKYPQYLDDSDPVFPPTD
jgi:hypothetical protein